MNLNDALLNLVCHETQDTWLHFEKGNVIMTDSLIQMSEHNLLLCGGEVRTNLFLILSQCFSTLSYYLGN